MPLNSTSQAAAVGSSAKNVQFGVSGANLVRRINIIATYDPLKTTVVDEVPIQVLNEADAGDKFGFGYPAHRLVKQSFIGSQGVETWVTPQAETGTASAGEIAWSGSVTAAGTISLRIANELYSIAIASGATIEEVSDAVVAAVNAVADAPVVATKTAVTFETVLTAKAKGVIGDDITITLSREQGEALPASLVGAITAMTGGAGVPDIQDALDGMGTGDDANEKFFTYVSHGYGLDTTTLDKVSAYVGLGNEFTGLYNKIVGRPFVSLNADNTAGSAGLTALQVITDARLTDRANGILGIPGSDSNPTEVAALATGIIARKALEDPAQNYTGQVLTGVHAGVSSDRWTKDYDSRDAAVKSGISPSKSQSDQLFLQNVVTFYRPASVPVDQNGFRSMRSIALIQEIINSMRVNFESEKWIGISIVDDVTNVTDVVAKQKARDIGSVQDDVFALADVFESKAWIFNASFAKQNSEVVIRTLSNGFDVNFKFKLSGEGQIIDITNSFDVKIT